jgi:N utilization substance protein A
VGPKTIEKLEAAGITSIEKLADMTPEQLVEIPGIGEKMVEKIHQSVAAYFEMLETQAAAGPGEQVEAVESAPEGAVEAQDAPEADTASEKPEVAEELESSEAPEAGDAEEAATETDARGADPLDSPGTADTRELPGEETPRHSIEGGEEAGDSEENVQK